MIEKVISGGQVGADIAALRAARALGKETGGWCPAGWRTKDGSCPELGTVYGLREHASALYPPRTFANVRESDATIRFALDFTSPGERCTMKAINKYRRPYYDVDLVWDGPVVRVAHPASKSTKRAKAWMTRMRVKVLNVAGNANPGIEDFVYNYMAELLN